MDSPTKKRATNSNIHRQRKTAPPKARKRLNISVDNNEKVDARSSAFCSDSAWDFAELHSTRKLHPHPGEVAFWDGVAVQLSRARTFEALQETARELSSTLPPLPEKYREATVTLDTVDELALETFPNDVPLSLLHHKPVEVYPDGNCFPRAVSRLVYGEEWHFLEMRCRLVMELANNCDLYLDNEYLMRKASHQYKKCENIAEQYSTYTRHYKATKHKLPDIAVVKGLFQEEVMALRTSGTYCGVWEFHAAANCIKRKLFGVYPRTPALHNIRNDHHRMFLPHDHNCTEMVAIMWTRTHQNSFSFDHFVPLCSPVSN